MVRVCRTTVVPEPQASDNSPDYQDRFEVTISGTDTRTAEQWLRAIFGEAPRLIRWFLLFGWRGVLGLRLGPRPSLNHILGWKIISKKPDQVCLELQSALMKAQLTLHLSNSKAVWSTYVYYTKPLARPLWTVVGLVHRRIVPYLLERAASY